MNPNKYYYRYSKVGFLLGIVKKGPMDPQGVQTRIRVLGMSSDSTTVSSEYSDSWGSLIGDSDERSTGPWVVLGTPTSRGSKRESIEA